VRNLQQEIERLKEETEIIQLKVRDLLTRTPYRCAVGLMIKTDEVSEQGCCSILVKRSCDTVSRMRDNTVKW
jgi:hypothetical protein